MNAHPAAVAVFFACAIVIGWVYFGYPFALNFGLLGARKHFERAAITPLVSVIIPAHNEEAGIEVKLRNLLALDYGREQVEILVGSDGSSDRTQEIVERFASEGVGLVSFPQHQGKSAIQNGLVALASGEILVFTDADCLLPARALRLLVQNFADPHVGLVTAYPKYVNATETAIAQNEGVYLRYETWLRKNESERGLLAMASGSLFAIRRSLWQPLDPTLGDDFALPLRMARLRTRNVIDSRVGVCTRLDQNEPTTMFGLKVRIISKDFRALLVNRALLNPFRYGTAALALWSHKLLRWFVPYFLLALLTSNCFLLGSRLFQVALAAQSIFFGIAFIALIFRPHATGFPWSVPMSFCIVNAAALLGTLKCLVGRTSAIWVPDRQSAPTAPSGSFESDDLADELI